MLRLFTLVLAFCLFLSVGAYAQASHEALGPMLERCQKFEAEVASKSVRSSHFELPIRDLQNAEKEGNGDDVMRLSARLKKINDFSVESQEGLSNCAWEINWWLMRIGSGEPIFQDLLDISARMRDLGRRQASLSDEKLKWIKALEKRYKKGK